MRPAFVLAASLLLASPSPVAADVLFSTTPIGPSPRTSDYGDVDQVGFRTYDDFLLATDASVTTVKWRGFWLGGAATPAPAPAPDVTSWEVAFYAAGAAAPGAVLASHTVAPLDVSTTWLGAGTFNQGGNTYNVNLYDLAVTLPSSFAASAGSTYWLSVFARSPTFSPLFAWTASADGLGNASFQELLGANLSVMTSNTVARDRAFTLEGTVPEPGALFLLGPAVVGIALRRRRPRTAAPSSSPRV